MIEIERKYEVDAGYVLPPLDGPNTVAVDAPPVTLTATYYDTADLRLARARTTLRRRTGGKDAGWHLKVPLGTEREEIQLPLGAARSVPAELAGLVLAHTRGARLLPVARLRTTRRPRTVSTADGVPLVEVADDHVRAQRLGTDTEVLQWREVEAELLPGARIEALSAVAGILTGAGARPARSASKLAHVLGDSVAAGAEVPEPRTRIGRKEPAGEAVTAYLRLQVRTLLALDPQARRGLDGAAAQMARTTRRLDGALRSFGGLIDAGTAAALQPELSWLDSELSEGQRQRSVRDRLQVAQDGLTDDLPAEAGALDLTGIVTGSDERVLAGRRYLALLDRLVALAADPPLTRVAGGKAKRVLPALVGRQWDRVDRRAQRAIAEPSDRALSRAAEAAGWLQSTAEAATPVYGDGAAALAARLAAIGDAVAAHESSAAVRALLLGLGRTPQEGFSCGLLYATEADRGREAIDELAAAWQEARRKRYRRWLT